MKSHPNFLQAVPETKGLFGGIPLNIYKEYYGIVQLRTLNNRIREFSYREGDIIPMTNSTNELIYRPDSIYPPLPDDTSIKPIPYMWD